MKLEDLFITAPVKETGSRPKAKSKSRKKSTNIVNEDKLPEHIVSQLAKHETGVPQIVTCSRQGFYLSHSVFS